MTEANGLCVTCMQHWGAEQKANALETKLAKAEAEADRVPALQRACFAILKACNWEVEKPEDIGDGEAERIESEIPLEIETWLKLWKEDSLQAKRVPVLEAALRGVLAAPMTDQYPGWIVYAADDSACCTFCYMSGGNPYDGAEIWAAWPHLPECPIPAVRAALIPEAQP